MATEYLPMLWIVMADISLNISYEKAEKFLDT